MVDIEMVGGLVEQQDLMLMSSGPDVVACLPLPGCPRIPMRCIIQTSDQS